jgi:hypothetical protein
MTKALLLQIKRPLQWKKIIKFSSKDLGNEGKKKKMKMKV